MGFLKKRKRHPFRKLLKQKKFDYNILRRSIMKKSKTNSKSIDTLTDELVGKRGTQKREKFEYELRMDILGTMIKEARIRKKLSQEQLGALIGVQKAQT